MSNERKPSEITDKEWNYIDSILPGSWEYSTENNAFVCNHDRRGHELPMKYVKMVQDYLTEIKINWYE